MLVVTIRVVGRGHAQRLVLVRAPAMESLVRAEVRTLITDWQSGAHEYDGLIYCMGYRSGCDFDPLYIG